MKLVSESPNRSGQDTNWRRRVGRSIGRGGGVGGKCDRRQHKSQSQAVVTVNWCDQGSGGSVTTVIITSSVSRWITAAMYLTRRLQSPVRAAQEPYRKVAIKH
ncbi:hypothetical protein J6590_016924 [Homalodisca vitripennis]|nr:hypothetical protein J6590_016924 [Homalodisca vitripennis]